LKTKRQEITEGKRKVSCQVFLPDIAINEQSKRKVTNAAYEQITNHPHLNEITIKKGATNSAHQRDTKISQATRDSN
jgi:hypothetical protein